VGLSLLPVELAEAQQPDKPVTLREVVDDGFQDPNVTQAQPRAQVLGEKFVRYRRALTGGRVLLDLDGAPDASGLGLSLEQADRAVRAQLGLPNDRGLVVASLTEDGPAARAGLQENDILLTLDEKPLDRPDDLVVRLKEAGEKTAPLALIRAGKPLTIRIKPEYRVVFKAIEPEKTAYYIGVPVKAIDATLRAHLPVLPEGQGLVVDGVQPESPAERAGLKPSDILLTIGESPVTDLDSFVAQIQATGGKTVPLKILREGKPMTIQITPAPRKEETTSKVLHDANDLLKSVTLSRQAHSNPYVVYLEKPYGSWIADVTNANQLRSGPTDDADRIEKRLDALDRELKQLRETIEALRTTLKRDDKPAGEPKR
jgi:serine protease Do